MAHTIDSRWRRAALARVEAAGDAPVLHQRSLRPNWTWREVVEVLVITPAVGETPEGVKTTALGRLKFARLSRLNISARNWRFSRSRICVSFKTEKSQVASPGPINVSLPTFP